MTAGLITYPVLYPLRDAAHYPEPRKAQRLEKMPLRCCRFQVHEPFYSSVRAGVLQFIADPGKRNYLPRWGRRCGYMSPKYQPVPLGDQIVRLGAQGLPRPLPSFVIAANTRTRQFDRGHTLHENHLPIPGPSCLQRHPLIPGDRTR